MRIRRATAEDIAGLMALERACATAAHWSEGEYRKMLEGGGRFALVADVGSDSDKNPHSSRTERGLNGALVAGFLVASHVAGEWEVQNIVVDAAARRNGLGMRLLEGLISKARDTRGEAVFLEVRESNIAGRKLYEKAGFAEVGRRKEYYTNPPEDAVLYRYGLR